MGQTLSRKDLIAYSDIVKIFPSINQKLLEKVIPWAETTTTKTDEQESIRIIPPLQVPSFFPENSMGAKSNDSMFEIAMERFDPENGGLVGYFY